MPDTPDAVTAEAERIIRCKHCNGTGWLEPIGPCSDGSYATSRRCNCDDGRPRTDVLRDAIATALLTEREAGRAEMREEAARWHDRERALLRVASDAAWVECVPDLALHAIKVHKQSASAIRSLSLKKEEGT